MLENRNIAIFLLALVVLGGLIIARPDFSSIGKENVPGSVSDVIPSDGKATVRIPSHATEVSPGVFFLGTTVVNGKMLEGYAMIDYKKGFGKPTGCNYDGKCTGWEDASCEDCTGLAVPDSSCYGFLSTGAKWRSKEEYVINAANKHGLGSSYIASNLEADIIKWESAASADVIGTGNLTDDVLVADLAQPDNKNEVYFGDVDGHDAIAVTIVWGIFRGPPGSRELVEWDMVFDQEDFLWSDSGESGKMDFENIATHELGHVLGLDDLYETSCSEETMYGYADYGETKKRTLGDGDKAGVKELYS